MPIELEHVGVTGLVTVNRPEALNVLDFEHLSDLRDLLEELATNSDVRAVILTGAGERAFVAGADIKYMRDLEVLDARAWGALGHACGSLLETMPKPTIAAINGFAIGGGCELALACDLRVASSTAKLGQPEINLGIIPGWGGTQRLARTTTIAFAKELVLTGRLVGADEALAKGLVQAIHEPSALRDKALELAGELGSKSPVALAYAKEVANLALSGDHVENLVTEARLFSMLFSTEDQKEGMAAFIEKRPPEFNGQ